MLDPLQLVRPRRAIRGMSAVLLPFAQSGEVDWDAFRAHVSRTAEAGLVPAVNMDTGYGNLLDSRTKQQVLQATSEMVSGQGWIGGVFVADQPGAALDFDTYARGLQEIQQLGGLPIVFQSYGLAHQPDDLIVANYQRLATAADRFLAFELGTMFAPFGRIYNLEVYHELLRIEACVGAKHSSLCRVQEWERLQLRNQVRPKFLVLTGNDLAIDMVMYGSDYLLGVSTFCPDLFARRDRMWAAGDPAFYELNDALQYLGAFAFRSPTPAYKHNAAMFLHQRGWIPTDLTHPQSPRRPRSDREVLHAIGSRLGLEMNQ